MPFGSVQLIAGVNTERTPTLLRTGYSTTAYSRFKDGLWQKLGGWVRYFNLVIAGIPRDLHVWEDLNLLQHLLIGSTEGLFVLTNGTLTNITPQQFVSNFVPSFSTSMNSPTVTITDPNVNNVTVDDSVFFNTPISVGGLVLFGMFPVTAALGGSSYQITAATNATSTILSGGVVPEFTTTLGSSVVTVTIPNHGLAGMLVPVVVFQIPTTGNGVTINSNYDVASIIDANNFTIVASTQATGNGSFFMNGGNAQLVYFIAIGPPPSGSGYGTGGYGLGGYAQGSSGGGGDQTGTPITATDWTTANWGEIALACPAGGGIYSWDPASGFNNAGIVPGAPTFCGGIFVSTSQQILVAWGSSFAQSVGIEFDPLLVSWSASGDFTNWVPLSSDQAGDFRIPFGSKIMGGIATPTQNLIWTDLDCWVMNYLGPPLVYGFNNIGAGAGLISSHAAMQFRSSVYWMGLSNFYATTPGGVAVIPCPVWDFVFQNLLPGNDPNTGLPFTSKIRAMPNTNFNEVGWLFPSVNSPDGENDSYVKMNVTEQGNPWDTGPSNTLPRSAWTDQSILGPPLSASDAGIIFQQETTMDADGAPMPYSFTTGYFFIAEGEDFAYVDQIHPDFKWGFYGQAQNATVQITINVINYLSDTPTQYGPYSVTATGQQFISTRFRGRQMSFTISGNDLGTFVRLGMIRYRWRPMGRR